MNMLKQNLIFYESDASSDDTGLLPCIDNKTFDKFGITLTENSKKKSEEVESKECL